MLHSCHEAVAQPWFLSTLLLASPVCQRRYNRFQRRQIPKRKGVLVGLLALVPWAS